LLTNKRNSIFFQINIFFICIFIIINVLIFTQFIIDNQAYSLIEKRRYSNAIKILLDGKRDKISDEAINKQLESFHLSISYIDFKRLETEASKIESSNDSPLEILYYNNKKYLRLKPPRFFMPPPPQNFFPPKEEQRFSQPPNFNINDFPHYILIDESDARSFQYFWLFILMIIDILLVWFFIFLKKKLTPLNKLKKEIIKFSNGDLSISTKNNGNDEISQVANEFDNAILQLRQLKESRNLFLRNIMHELKTPITKGKLIADTLNQTQRKDILIRVFQRLEYLLSEFAKIEELTSGTIQLVKNRYRVIDLLEHALDILLIKKDKVEIHNKDFILDVDFDLFSIALKNLIDNAIKYNENGKVEIFIEKDSIRIRNQGIRLEKNIEEYLKPFNKEQKNTKEGLGLGLYITNSIIKIHHLELDYFYEESYHNFIIKTT